MQSGESKEINRITVLRLHPNYCVDTSTTISGDARHATLPTSFFAAQGSTTTQENEVSAVS